MAVRGKANKPMTTECRGLFTPIRAENQRPQGQNTFSHIRSITSVYCFTTPSSHADIVSRGKPVGNGSHGHLTCALVMMHFHTFVFFNIHGTHMMLSHRNGYASHPEQVLGWCSAGKWSIMRPSPVFTDWKMNWSITAYFVTRCVCYLLHLYELLKMLAV